THTLTSTKSYADPSPILELTIHPSRRLCPALTTTSTTVACVTILIQLLSHQQLQRVFNLSINSRQPSNCRLPYDFLTLSERHPIPLSHQPISCLTPSVQRISVQDLCNRTTFSKINNIQQHSRLWTLDCRPTPTSYFILYASSLLTNQVDPPSHHLTNSREVVPSSNPIGTPNREEQTAHLSFSYSLAIYH